MRYFISSIIVLFSLYNHSAYAQFNFRFKKLTVKDGLSQSAVSSIIQDRFGFLWVGTRDGLNRYDGYTFKQYYHQPKDTNSLPGNIIGAISLDPQKNLWVATTDFICQYDSSHDCFISYPIRITRYQQKNPVTVKNMYWKNSREAILATTEGIFLFNTQTRQFSIPARYRKFTGHSVLSIVPDSTAQDEWVADHTGVYRATPNNKSGWQLYLASQQYPTYVIKTSANVVMASAQQYIYVLDTGSNKFRITGKAKARQFIANMQELSNKQVWMSWGNVGIFDAKGNHLNDITYEPNNPFSLSRDIVTSVYESQDGIIWLATNGYGLNKLDLKLSRFGYIGAFPQTRVTLNNMYNQAIYTANDTLLYVATSQGLNVIDLIKKTSQAFNNPKNKFSNRFNCLKPMGKKALWVASDNGLWIFKNQKFVQISNKFLGGKIIIYQIEQITPQTLMLATGEGTLLWNHKINKITPLTHSQQASVFLRFPWGFLEGSESGLREFDLKGKLKNHFRANKKQATSLQSNSIKCIFQDSRQRIWIGSWGGGLSRYRPETRTFVNYGKKDGLPNSVVYGILEDSKHQLWLSTNKGLNVFNPVTKKFRNFQAVDGLQGNEFNTRSFFKSSGGRMYFGGINGLTYFDPETTLKTQRYIPKTALIGFYTNGKKGLQINDAFGVESILQKHSVTLGWNIYEFSFEVAGLGYSLPGHTRYKYRMTPFAKDWIEMGKRRYIHFTNLAPGEYMLHVKAANSEGQWEKKGLIIKVIITDPFWLKWWFIALCISIIAGLVFFLYLNRTNQLKRKAQKLARTVDIRTKEIQLKNNEIATQNEELQTQAKLLIEKNELLETIKENLEEKVKERTKT